MSPTCHPERRHYGKGLCEPCWRRAYQRDRYATESKAARKKRQAAVRKAVAAFRARRRAQAGS